MNRRGFTLTELIMSLMVMGLLGAALTRILINDSRFISRQDAMLSSRQGARAALNTVLAELSLVADDGLVAASRDSVRVRVPYAFGVACRTTSGTKIMSILPVDSLAWAWAAFEGTYWRQSTGGYARRTGGSVSSGTATDTALCTADSVRVIPGGKLIRVSGSANTIDSLSIVMLYQTVTYRFAASADLPGRIGLWREGTTSEELVTPFDSGAGFAFLVGGPKAATLTRQTAPPADLNTVRGLELMLYAASEFAPQGTSAPQVFPLKTRVMFTNKVL